MDQIAQLLVNGISVGSIIALSGIGLTLTYGILRLSNFAHGDYMTLGAYLTLLFDSLLAAAWGQQGVNVWLAMGLSILVSIGFALLWETLLWAPMRAKRATSTTLVILSIGLALFLRNGIMLIWGASNQRYRLPVPEALSWGSIRLPFYNLVVISMAILAMVGLHLLLRYTKIGKAMRAVADDIDLARVTGINVERVVLWTWVLAGGLTALGGSMLGLVETLTPNMGWFLVLPLFAAVILGGIGNPYGAITGAFLIGIAQEVSTIVIPVSYKSGVALVMMMLVLLVRPQGLFRGTL
jgi:neutral amino acid transport system permease protein